MARVIYGGGVTEFIGSISGNTYQSNGSGFIVRNKPIITKQRSSYQSNQLTTFTYLSQYYRNLSLVNKGLWSAFASANNHTTLWNETKIIDGLQWFINISTTLLRDGQPISNTPPTFTLSTALPVMSLDLSANTLLLTSAVPFGIVNEVLVIFCSNSLNSNTSVPRKSFRYIKVVSALSASPIDLTADWENIFGLNFNNDVTSPGNTVIVGVTKYISPNYILLPFSFAI